MCPFISHYLTKLKEHGLTANTTLRGDGAMIFARIQTTDNQQVGANVTAHKLAETQSPQIQRMDKEPNILN